MAKGFVPRAKIWFLAVPILAGYGAVGFRLFELQVTEAPRLAQELEQSRFRVVVENPRRGNILDVNGELLATSQTFLEVGVDQVALKESDLPKLGALAKLLELSQPQVENAFEVQRGSFVGGTDTRRDRWRLLKRRVRERVYQRVMDLKIAGVYGTRKYARVYPNDSLAVHVIGYVRRDGQAVSGVERSFDFYLSGQSGWLEAEFKAGNEMAQFRRRHVPARNGMSVQLSIDSYVQYAIEEELEFIARSLDPKSASIIVSDPFSGFILGLANYPTFDPNAYSTAKIANQVNRALTDPIEPGSTFKIVAASAALEEGVVAVDTRFDCGLDSIVTSSGYVARLPRDSHSNGILSVADIVAQSSNRGAAHLGVLLGERRFHDYTERFGFGEETGLGIGPESRGIVNPVSEWDGLTITRMPMGHAISATPLQIHSAMAVVANGGILMRPQIITSILKESGEVAMSFGPVARRRVISSSTASTVASLLEKTVSPAGTAVGAAIPGYRVAGKTGTSQKIVDGRYSTRDHVGSFCGFFPANDPKIAITVVVDGAKTLGTAYGSVVAVPSFKKVANKLIPYFAISPSALGDALATDSPLPDHVVVDR